MSRRLRRRTMVFVGVGVLVATAGCGDGDETPALDTAPPVTEEAPPPSPAPSSADDEPANDTATDEPEGGPEPFPDDVSAAEQEPGGAQLLTVTDVRLGRHDGYDRVVFDLGGEGTPGWNVEYVDEAADDGSGEPVEVGGDAVLSVRISGTAMPMDSGVEEFEGGAIEISDDGVSEESVEEVVYRFWFEGYTTAFIGIEGDRTPFRVFALEDPARVVVDVQH
jgi:hypothetical protein